MGTAEPESRTERLRAARRRRRRTALVLTTGLVLGMGALATTSSSADTKLLHILNVAKSEPVSAARSAAKSATRARTGAKSGRKPSASASASAGPTPKPTQKAAPSASPTAAATPVAAPPTTAIGQSEVLTQAQQPAQVGALFSGGLDGTHHCTASVVDSPAGDIIVTAGHCLTTGSTTSDVFIPGYRDGTAPHGVWQISSVVEADAWTSGGDVDDDVAFAVVEPLNGRSIESVVGSYTLGTDAVSSAQVQLTGYPSASNEPISCTGDGSAFTADQLQIYCTAYTNGTSGSGWISGYDPATGTGTLIGVIGGYETGGDTPDVSYSPLFGSSVRALYDQALSQAG
ncbi:serine protease [Streptacidiphilus sp. P02-A3a]|uniref:trypsin-like serine peptidase n=1 Tax=Streptacidiphilus sp. P02-A3a TaxID=2704468 RepID=UPI0015FC6B13|nr:trypsin-like serine protease [Streptacidiphilus sp. P02-A3a]QMU70807.1 trypsin-like serine protease [Streptacidiphilus sp. P02-A3a]